MATVKPMVLPVYDRELSITHFAPILVINLWVAVSVEIRTRRRANYTLNMRIQFYQV